MADPAKNPTLSAHKAVATDISSWTVWILTALLLSATALHLATDWQSQSHLYIFLCTAVLLLVGIFALLRLPVRAVSRVVSCSALMTAFVLTTHALFPMPGNAMLLFLPVINAACLLDRRTTIAITAACTACWLYLRWGIALPERQLLVQTLIELVPLWPVALLLQQQSAVIAKNQSRMAALSDQDDLTGLMNIRTFMNTLLQKHLDAAAQKNSYALLMVDIEGLQRINEQYGYEQGNRAVLAVADALKRSAGSNDLLARYGGDEFILYVPGADAAAAQEMNNRVRQNVYNITLAIGRKMLRIVVSVGTAVYPDNGGTVQEVMVFADRAMYRDKDFRQATRSGESQRDAGRKQAGIEKY